MSACLRIASIIGSEAQALVSAPICLASVSASRAFFSRLISTSRALVPVPLSRSFAVFATSCFSFSTDCFSAFVSPGRFFLVRSLLVSLLASCLAVFCIAVVSGVSPGMAGFHALIRTDRSVSTGTTHSQRCSRSGRSLRRVVAASGTCESCASMWRCCIGVSVGCCVNHHAAAKASARPLI